MESLIIHKAIPGAESLSEESLLHYVGLGLGQGRSLGVLAVEVVSDPANLLLGGQGEDLAVQQN